MPILWIWKSTHLHLLNTARWRRGASEDSRHRRSEQRRGLRGAGRGRGTDTDEAAEHRGGLLGGGGGGTGANTEEAAEQGLPCAAERRGGLLDGGRGNTAGGFEAREHHKEGRVRPIQSNIQRCIESWEAVQWMNKYLGKFPIPILRISKQVILDVLNTNSKF